MRSPLLFVSLEHTFMTSPHPSGPILRCGAVVPYQVVVSSGDVEAVPEVSVEAVDAHGPSRTGRLCNTFAR